MVKKSLIVGMVVFILAFSFVNSASPEVKIKTLADHKVSVFVYESGEIATLDSHHGESDGVGDYSHTFSSDVATIDIRVIIKNLNNNQVFNEKFEGYNPDETIWLRIDYDEINGEYNPDEVAEDEPVEEAVVVETPEENNSETEISEVEETNENIDRSSDEEIVTGQVVSNVGGSNFTNIVFYIVGGLIVVGILFIFVKKSSKTKSEKSQGNVAGNAPRNNSNSDESEELKKLELKVSETQRELGMLRNKEKIKQAEAKLEADRRELERLKGSME